MIATSKTLQANRWYWMTTGQGERCKVAPLVGVGIVRIFDGSGLSGASVMWSAICDNGHRTQISNHDLDRLGIGGLQGPIEDEPALDSEGIRALDGKAEMIRWRHEKEADAKKESERLEREKLPALYPDLETFEQRQTRLGKPTSGHALGSANIKRELSKAFKGVKFRVSSESFSGGDAIRIGWEYGPTEKEVEAITDRYSEGDFNGMDDSYNYRHSMFTDLFGGAKYVTVSRSIPHDNSITGNWFETSLYGDIGREICRLQAVEFKGENTPNVCGANDVRQLRDYVNEIINSYTFPAGFVQSDFVRLERSEYIDGEGYQDDKPWKIVLAK